MADNLNLIHTPAILQPQIPPQNYEPAKSSTIDQCRTFVKWKLLP